MQQPTKNFGGQLPVAQTSKVYFWTTDNTGTDELDLGAEQKSARKILVSSALGVGTITLPPSADWEGEFITVICQIGTNAITIDEADGTELIATLDAAGDRAMVYSDGTEVYLVCSHVA